MGLSVGPHRMMEVDNVGVPMLQRGVPVRMAMRLRPFPAFVYMAMMHIVGMEVLMIQRRVHMFQLARVVSRP